MSDKLVVDVDSSDAVLATKQMEALTGAVISMGEAFKSAKGSTAALKELRSLLVGLKGKGSAFDELSAAIKDLNRNSDLLRGSFETSIGQLNRTLKAEMAELKAQLRTDALEAGRQMGNGLEEGLKEADAKVKRQGRTLAATARAEATRVYEAMVAGQANAKVKDPATLFKLEEAGATLSPYHKQVLANWKRSSAETFRALKEQLKQENAEIAATVKAEEAALQMALKGMEERSNLRSASLADIYAGSLRRGKQNISSVKTALKEQSTEVAATVKAEEAALQMALKSMEERSAIRATSMADIYARSLVRGRQSVARVKEELRTQAAELAAAVAAQNATVAKQVQAATNAPVGVYQRYNASTGAAGGIVNPDDAKNLSKTSKLLKAFTLDANDAHSAARGLASGFGLLWLTWGNMVPLLAGAAISHSFATIVKSGSEVQHNLTQIKTLAGATGAEVQGLSDQMLNLARTGPYAPREIAEAMKTLALAGLNAKETYAAIPEVLNFAVAGTTSVKQAADALTTIGTAFNITADNYGYISDVIAKTAAESKTSVESISEAFKTASVINQQYGVSLEDTAVGLALLANAGIQNSAAGTALRNMYADLAGRTPKVTKALKELEVTALDPVTGKMREQAAVFKDLLAALSTRSAIDQTKYVSRIFGERGEKEAVQILNALRKAGKEAETVYDELAQKIADSAGFASVAAAELSLTPLNQMKQVATTLEATFVEVFASLQPYIVDFSRELRTLFSSDTFKDGLRTLVTTVGEAARFLIDHGQVIGTVIGTYAAYQLAVLGIGGATQAATLAVRGLTAAMALLTKANPIMLAISAAVTAAAVGWALLADNVEQGKEATDTYTSSSADQLLEALEKEADRLRAVNEAREEGISLQELEARVALKKAQNDEPIALRKAREKLAAIPEKPQYSAVAGNADPFAAQRHAALQEVQREEEKFGGVLLQIKKTIGDITELRKVAAEAGRKQSKPTPPIAGTDTVGSAVQKEREQRLRLQNDNELKQIEARLKSELNLNTTYYATEKSQLEARYNANIISVAEYQSEYTRLTKEAEQKRIAIYGESSDKYGKALADRFSAMQQAFTSQIKGSQVGGELQGIIAGVNASLESGAQAYSSYYEAAAAGDYSAQEALAASLYNSKTALDAYIESLRNYVELQPEGPTKKLAAEMLNAAQAAATFQQANADAIQGSHVKMVEDSRKAYYDLAKMVGEASRSSQEFWKKERNELAEQKAVEALEQQYRFLNESVFSSDVATKAAALAREKAISKYRQEMEKLNTVAKKAEDAVNSWATEYGAAIASGNKEAIKTLEQLIELRDKMNGDRATFVAEAAASTEDLTLAAFEKARREQIEAWSSELGDAIQTSIFEGGKAGGEKFIAILRRELLTKPLQAFINATINAVTGGLMNGLVGGAVSGAASSFGGSLLGSAAGSLTGNWLGAGSAMGMLGNIGAGVTTGMGTLFTEGFSAWVSQATGLMEAGSMGGGLGALLGPVALLGGAAMLLSSFDKSGTPHYGAAAEYSSGKTTGTEAMFLANKGISGQYSKDAQSGVSAVAAGAGAALDAISKMFGGAGGYKISTAYSDDSSSDPGFGSLKITQGSKTVTDWGATRTSKWADKIFADGEEGVKLYTQAVARDVRQAMVDMGLPDWAKKILTDLGDEIDLTALSNAITKISQTQAVFTGLNDSLDGFARLSGEAKLSIMDAAGGVEALAAYNELVGNTGAQVAQAMQTLSDTLTEAGADAVPTTVYALQKMLNTLDLTSEEGQKLAAALISVAPALKSITEALDTAMQNRSTLYGGYGLTAKAFEDLSAQFDLLGYQVPETSSQYRELIAAQVAMGDAGTATLISLSNLVPAWEAYNQQLEDTRQRLVTFWSGLSSSLASIESQLASLGDTADDGGAQAAYQDAMTAYNAEMEIYNRLSNAQNSILDFVSSLTSGTLSELGTAQLSLEQMQSRFASDLQAAMEGDADATEKLIKSSKSLLDAQIKRSSTGVEARRAAAQMAIALGNLPEPTEPTKPTAPNTPKKDKTQELLNLLKENLLAIKDLVRAIHENEMSVDLRLNLEEAANQFKVTLDAIMNADISDSLKAFATRINTGLTKMLTVTIKAGIDDEAFVAQVSDTVKALSKAIELTVTSVLDEGSMGAMLQSIENTRVTLQVVLDSKVSNDIKNIANEVLEGVGVIIQKAVTTPGMSKDDILTVYGLNEALSKVVNLTVSTDKIPDDLRAMVLESATTSTKTIQLAIENFKGTDKDIIFAAEADALKTIQLAVASGNPEAIKLATTESNSISVVVAAYAKDGKLPDDIAKLLQEGDTQKIIDVALKIEASKYKMEVDSLLEARDVEVKLSMGDTTAIKTAVDALTAQQSITFAAVFSGSESTAAEIANLAKAQDVVYQAHVEAGDSPQKLAELAKAQDVTLTAVLADAIALEAKAALAADSKLTITAALDSAQAELQKAVLAQDPGLVITPELQAAIAESALAQLTATRQADVAVTADTTEAKIALAEVTTGNTAVVDAVVDTTHIITELSTAAAGPYTATINATTAGVPEVASAISSVASASYPATVQVTESGSSDVASAISSVAGASYSATVAVAESGVSEVASALSAVAGASYSATVVVTESGLGETSDAITKVAGEDYTAIIKVIEKGSAAAAAAIQAVAGASYTATINTTHVITTIHEDIYVSSGSPTPSALGNIFSGGLVPFANGGVFGSITPFANGGLPTNSIINSPMLFDMGLAGEAGPEAIMPLSRDSRGRLGVKVIGDNAPKVAVVESDNVSEELLANLLEQLSAVREELQGLRAEAASTATSSYKTAKLLTRAMPDGRAILTTSTV